MYSVFQGWFGDNKYAGFQQYALIDAELAAKVRRAADEIARVVSGRRVFSNPH